MTVDLFFTNPQSECCDNVEYRYKVLVLMQMSRIQAAQHGCLLQDPHSCILLQFKNIIMASIKYDYQSNNVSEPSGRAP